MQVNINELNTQGIYPIPSERSHVNNRNKCENNLAAERQPWGRKDAPNAFLKSIKL
jgi:hypothetical protein